ncbi:MAG: glycoside hydrolase family 88 protein [Bacteroidota bacterium]
MKRFLLVSLACYGMYAAARVPKTTPATPMEKLISENFQFAEQQYRYLRNSAPYDSMPRTYKDGRNVNSDLEWWTSGFYPGTILYIYEFSRHPELLEEAKKRLNALEVEQTNTINHDLGFKMFCSFGNAYRLTKDGKYKAVILQSSKSLATRYRPVISSIQSWNKSKAFNCPVIIDNMMNLEMLEWASNNGGSKELATISVNHSNATLKNHFRDNYSSYHVLDYDLTTGKIIKKVTSQGANDTSAWSRGQGWALYGFTMMYRFTKNKTYLSQAKGIAGFIMNHPNLPEDKIPYWDFDAPGIPDAPRDVSAASVYASALLELAQYCKGTERQGYIDLAKKILVSLSSKAYRAGLGENGGFILKHSVGSIPHKSEIDVPLTYADYYFMEALLRYKRWYLN